MPIVSLLQQAGFNPEDTHILTEAFDKAWTKFKSSGHALSGEACAPSRRAIIETAQKGERNVIGWSRTEWPIWPRLNKRPVGDDTHTIRSLGKRTVRSPPSKCRRICHGQEPFGWVSSCVA